MWSDVGGKFTLAELGITAINLSPDATHIVLPDGSVITGQTTFTKSDGSTATVANTTLTTEADGHRVVQVASTDANGARSIDTKVYGTGGQLLSASVMVTSADGRTVNTSYDEMRPARLRTWRRRSRCSPNDSRIGFRRCCGDGVVDRLQSVITTLDASGIKTEVMENKLGNSQSSAITANRLTTITSADGKTITLNRDSSGGGWTDSQEIRTTHADGSRTLLIKDLAQSGVVITSALQTISANGLTRSTAIDSDGDGDTDTVTTLTITVKDVTTFCGRSRAESERRMAA